MNELVIFTDYLLIGLSVFYLYKNIQRLLWSSRSIYFLIFFVLYVLPVFLDYFVGFQEHYHWGFSVASNHPATRTIYNFALIIIMHVLVYYRNTKPRLDFQEYLRDSGDYAAGYNKLFVFFMVFPAVATLLLLRTPGMLYTFQWREFEIYNTGGSYSTIEKITYFGIVCSVLLLFDPRRKVIDFSRLIALLFLYVNVCIQGKRAILFFAIIAIFIVVVIQYFSLKVQRKRTFLYTAVFLVIASVGVVYMILSSIEVKIGRGYSETAEELLYTSTRIDLFREDRVKMAIFSELNPDEMRILDYKGQSLITNVVSIVPFNYISEPLGLSQGTYQVHFSMAMFREKYNYFNPKANRNYMTCTMFAEAISNFGIIIGTLLFIIITLWCIRLTDAYPRPFNILIITAYTLLNLFDFVYMVLYIELTWLFCLLYKNKLLKFYNRRYSNLVNK